MAEVLCVRHTLEDQYRNVYAWRIVPQSVETVQWPEALRARADMEGWVTKRTDPFWHNYGDDVPEATAQVWQAIATGLYKALSNYYEGQEGEPEWHDAALAAMAAYDSEMGWTEDQTHETAVVVEMPTQPEAYLG